MYFQKQVADSRRRIVLLSFCLRCIFKSVFRSNSWLLTRALYYSLFCLKCIPNVFSKVIYGYPKEQCTKFSICLRCIFFYLFLETHVYLVTLCGRNEHIFATSLIVLESKIPSITGFRKTI